MVWYIYYAVCNTVTLWRHAQTIYAECGNDSQKPWKQQAPTTRIRRLASSDQRMNSGCDDWHHSSDHRRTNISLGCIFTLRYFCTCKTGIQFILCHQNFKDHTSNKTLKITLVILIACLSSWWMVLEPNFSSNV